MRIFNFALLIALNHNAPNFMNWSSFITTLRVRDYRYKYHKRHAAKHGKKIQSH